MQFGEAAAPTIANVDHDEDCYFCRSKDKPGPELNELEQDPTDDGPSEGDLPFKNDASKLGNALQANGKPQVEKEVQLDKSYVAGTAAHHLIPGNASMKKSQLFLSKKYLWKDGKANGNIGYNINSSPNGVWLPGNYAQRPWGADGAGFRASTGQEPQAYAFAAMEAFQRQFHDAHPDYSKFVMDVLNKIHAKLKANNDIGCPEAAKRKDVPPEEQAPMYVLVTRLNTVSKRMERLLTFPAETNWKKNVYTSRFAQQYMKKLEEETP